MLCSHCAIFIIFLDMDFEKLHIFMPYDLPVYNLCTSIFWYFISYGVLWDVQRKYKIMMLPSKSSRTREGKNSQVKSSNYFRAEELGRDTFLPRCCHTPAVCSSPVPPDKLPSFAGICSQYQVPEVPTSVSGPLVSPISAHKCSTLMAVLVVLSSACTLWLFTISISKIHVL